MCTTTVTFAAVGCALVAIVTLFCRGTAGTIFDGCRVCAGPIFSAFLGGTWVAITTSTIYVYAIPVRGVTEVNGAEVLINAIILILDKETAFARSRVTRVGCT